MRRGWRRKPWPAERDLVARVDQVVQVTFSFGAVQRQALIRCVSLMSDGMHRFQRKVGLRGLDSQQRLDEYCYFVAGVVGEMLTELFCEYSGAIARRRDQLMRLAPSFGQGLQMTNILKDIRADPRAGVCWLPRLRSASAAGQGDLIAELDGHGFASAWSGSRSSRTVTCEKCVELYLADSAPSFLGIRRFCLWALGMAVPTLDNIYRNPVFESATRSRSRAPTCAESCAGTA